MENTIILKKSAIYTVNEVMTAISKSDLRDEQKKTIADDIMLLVETYNMGDGMVDYNILHQAASDNGLVISIREAKEYSKKDIAHVLSNNNIYGHKYKESDVPDALVAPFNTEMNSLVDKYPDLDPMSSDDYLGEADDKFYDALVNLTTPHGISLFDQSKLPGGKMHNESIKEGWEDHVSDEMLSAAKELLKYGAGGSSAKQICDKLLLCKDSQGKYFSTDCSFNDARAAVEKAAAELNVNFQYNSWTDTHDKGWESHKAKYVNETSVPENKNYWADSKSIPESTWTPGTNLIVRNTVTGNIERGVVARDRKLPFYSKRLDSYLLHIGESKKPVYISRTRLIKEELATSGDISIPYEIDVANDMGSYPNSKPEVVAKHVLGTAIEDARIISTTGKPTPISTDNGQLVSGTKYKFMLTGTPADLARFCNMGESEFKAEYLNENNLPKKSISRVKINEDDDDAMKAFKIKMISGLVKDNLKSKPATEDEIIALLNKADGTGSWPNGLVEDEHLSEEDIKKIVSACMVNESRVNEGFAWDDSNFLDKPATPDKGTFAPFHKLSSSAQADAKNAYPKETKGGKYDFAPEHFFYPVKTDGSLGSGNRSLAIPYDKIKDDSYMQSLGYTKRADWNETNESKTRIYEEATYQQLRDLCTKLGLADDVYGKLVDLIEADTQNPASVKAKIVSLVGGHENANTILDLIGGLENANEDKDEPSHKDIEILSAIDSASNIGTGVKGQEMLDILLRKGYTRTEIASSMKANGVKLEDYGVTPDMLTESLSDNSTSIQYVWLMKGGTSEQDMKDAFGKTAAGLPFKYTFGQYEDEGTGGDASLSIELTGTEKGLYDFLANHTGEVTSEDEFRDIFLNESKDKMPSFIKDKRKKKAIKESDDAQVGKLKTGLLKYIADTAKDDAENADYWNSFIGKINDCDSVDCIKDLIKDMDADAADEIFGEISDGEVNEDAVYDVIGQKEAKDVVEGDRVKGNFVETGIGMAIVKTVEITTDGKIKIMYDGFTKPCYYKPDDNMDLVGKNKITESVDNSQLVRITNGGVKMGFDGQTFKNGVMAAAQMIKNSQANIDGFKCYTFNDKTDITDDFKSAVNAATPSDTNESAEGTGMLHHIQQEISGGMISSHIGDSDYKTIDAVRSKALDILGKEGDQAYSIENVKALLNRAKTELATPANEDTIPRHKVGEKVDVDKNGDTFSGTVKSVGPELSYEIELADGSIRGVDHSHILNSVIAEEAEDTFDVKSKSIYHADSENDAKKYADYINTPDKDGNKSTREVMPMKHTDDTWHVVDKKDIPQKANESSDDGEMSTIQLAKAYKVKLTQADLEEMGNNTTRTKFKEYFSIPVDADENPDYFYHKDFNPDSLNGLKSIDEDEEAGAAMENKVILISDLKMFKESIANTGVKFGIKSTKTVGDKKVFEMKASGKASEIKKIRGIFEADDKIGTGATVTVVGDRQQGKYEVELGKKKKKIPGFDDAEMWGATITKLIENDYDYKVGDKVVVMKGAYSTSGTADSFGAIEPFDDED